MNYDLRYDDTNCDPDKWVPISDINVITRSKVGSRLLKFLRRSGSSRESGIFFSFFWVLGL